MQTRHTSRIFSIASPAAILVFLLLALRASPAVAEYDGVQALLDDEARQAMADGNYPRARHFFHRLLMIDPNDPRALREAARCAQAMGDLEYAEQTLAKVEVMQQGIPDPELHYLRAEALMALQRRPEAMAEYKKAEAELPRGPNDRAGSLWLARIYALRGDLDAADAIYARWMPEYVRTPAYAEIMTAEAEAHILSKDWAGAEKIVKRLLEQQPNNAHAREMMAWIHEARGDVDDEIRIRARIADEVGTDPGGRVLRYAQALERSGDYHGALTRYREAESLGVDQASLDADRMEHRLSPEVSAAAVVRDDPSGTILGGQTGVTVPFGSQFRVGIVGIRESVSDAPSWSMTPDGTLTAVTASAVLADRRGDAIAFYGTGHESSAVGELRVGAGAAVRTAPWHTLQLQASGETRMPWRESSTTVAQGGTADTASVNVYASPFTDRLVFGLGGQARRLELAPMAGSPDTTPANQLFASGGVDWIVQTDPRSAARGEILDESMLWPSALSAALVVSYRHYQLASDNPFGQRLVLVERSQVDELSAAVRRVFGARGAVGIEARGGAGYDWDRVVQLWRAGGSLFVSPTSNSRLSLIYDAASESGTGLTGRRHIGWVTLHVDL
jgi:tetratricopeptide (TPR) repeat protein